MADVKAQAQILQLQRQLEELVRERDALGKGACVRAACAGGRRRAACRAH